MNWLSLFACTWNHLESHIQGRNDDDEMAKDIQFSLVRMRSIMVIRSGWRKDLQYTLNITLSF